MRKRRKKIENGLLKAILIAVLFAGVSYYVVHPALDLHNPGFYHFLLPILIVFLVSKSIFDVAFVVENWNTGRIRINNREAAKIWFLIPICLLLIFLVMLINSPMFNAKKYYERIQIDTTRSFQDEIQEVDFQKLPLLDKKSSEKLGDRVMGGMSELVSQYDVSDEYTQINYNDEIIRVTPLEYNGLIKWFTNRKNGITGYIKVNSTNGKAELVKLSKGLKYAPSAKFNENLYRKLQFQYPFKNFDAINFEIDNDGNPYWIASVVKYHGIGQRRDVVGVVIFNPVDGSSNYYKVEDVPNWVDHVYEADLILSQVNDWGAYKNGFLNSIFAQKDVVATTTGYNYLAFNNDVYLYTGITSVLSDESNIGFILTNMRTKDTNFYSVSGAEEYSAMDSAKGQVQQMRYDSTFPLLINLSGRPTYLISLKDNAGLVKMYAFVDVVDYQKVVVTDASKGIEVAAEAYLNQMDSEISSSSNMTKSIMIQSIKDVIIEGNTIYYFQDEMGQKYKVSIKVNKDLLPFIYNGDHVTINYSKEQEVINVTGIKLGE